MTARIPGWWVVLVSVLAVGVCALGIGAPGVGAEPTVDQERVVPSEPVEWSDGQWAFAPSETGGEDAENGTSTGGDGGDATGASERGGTGGAFDDEVYEVGIDELGTLDEPGVYATDISGIDTVELAVLGPGGGGAGYISDGNGGVKDGGAGGSVNGTWDVSEFTQLVVTVGEGGGGGDALLGEGSGGEGYFSGGAGGFDDDDTAGGGGGGATVVEAFDGGGDSVLLAAAGGGGGGAAWNESSLPSPSVESAGGGGAPGGSGGSTSFAGGSGGSDGEDSSGIISNDIGAPGGDAGDTSADPGGIGGWWVNTTYAESYTGEVGGGASGGSGGASFDGELGDPGDDGSVDVTTPNVVVQSTSAPGEIQPGENLTVSYTLSETNGIAAEESFVDLTINGSLEEFNSSVSVPAGGTTSGELTFTDTGLYDTMNWCVELSDYGDQSCGVTTIPDISIQSVSGPSEIMPGEDLTVDYTLQNSGGPGEESFVDLYVDGTLEEFDSGVFVPASGTTSGSISFSGTGRYGDGDTIDWSVELFDFGDTAGGTTDVVEDPAISIQSVSAPGLIPLDGDLSMEYTLANSGGDGTESAVDLVVGGTARDTDSNVFVPGGGTSSGTLTYSNVDSDFGYGDTIQWSVELADSGDTASGSTDIEAAPAGFQVSIQSTNAPVLVGETLSVDATVENTGGTEGTQTIALDVGVLGSDSTSVTLPAGSSTTVTLSVGTRSGDAGEYTAAVSSDNDTASTTVTVLSEANFDVTVQSTNTPVEGQQLSVDALVENTGGVEDTQTVTLSLPLGSASTTVTLGGGSSTVETLTVGTASGDAGEYTAAVSSEDDSATATVTILQSSAFQVSVQSTNSPVVAGENLTVETQVTNTGDTSGTQTVSLDVPGVGSDSTELTLGAGESVPQTFSVSTQSGDAGEYTAAVSSEDDTASRTVTVLEPGQFDVSITGVNEPVEGETLSVNATVTNTGGTSDAQTIDLVVSGLGTDSVAVGLDGGGSQNLTLGVPTAQGDGGEYTAAVSSDDDTASTTATVLAPGEFEVSVVDATSPVEGEPLVVDIAVENVGDLEETQTVGLDAGTLGANSTAVTLAGGASTVETLTVGTAAGDAGSYTVTASSDDDTADTTVDVLQQATFLVSVNATGEPVEGDALDIEVTVENTGDVAGTQAVGLDAGPLGTDDTAVTLGAGASTTTTLSVGTGVGDAGSYTVTVTSEDDSTSAAVTVLAAPVFDITLLGVTIENGVLNVSHEVENTGDIEATQTVTFDVDGVTEGQREFTLGGGSAAQASFTYSIASGDAPELAVAVASADDSDTTTVSVAPGQLDITVTDIDTSVVAGEELSVSVEGTNTGDEPLSETVQLLDIGGALVDETPVTLTGGETAQAQLVWATGADDVGTGEVTVDSATATAETRFVEVLAPAAFAVEVTDVNSPVAGEDLAVTAAVENTGAVEATQTVTLDVGALGTNSTQVTLSGGGSTTETLTVATETGDAGAYTATVTSENDTASTAVTVLQDAAFAVTIASVTEPVAGESLTVTATVTNTGEAEDSQTVTLDVPGLGTDAANVTLAGNASTAETFAVLTRTSDAGNYTATVASEDTADSRNVTVFEQPEFTVAITGATEPVAGEDLVVDAEVTNVGATTATETVTLTAGRLGETSTGVTLGAGETTEVGLSVGTAAGDAGSYTATVTTDDDSDSTTVTVLAPPAFEVGLTGATEPVAGDSLTVTADVQNTGEVEDSQTVTLDVPGLGTDATNVTLAGSASTTVTLSVETAAGDAGGYTATVASEDDQASQNVTVLGPAVLSVAILDATDPVAGEQLTVTVAVENTGDVEGTGSVDLEVPGLGGDETNVTLAPGASTEVGLSVETAAGDAGGYTATVTSADDSDSTGVVVTPPAAFDVAILDATDPVAGEQLTVTVAVENTGEVADSQTVTLDVPGLGGDETNVTLAGGASTEVGFSVETAAGDAGNYTVTVASADDQASQNVTVTQPEAFLVEIIEMDTTVIEGENVSMTVSVENVGAGPGTGLLTVDAGDLGSAERELDLAGGESTVETMTLSTELQQVGTYTVTVGMANDTDTETVDVSLPKLPGTDSRPQDVTGDGLREDTDGDGAFTIFDVQTFFNSFTTSPVTEHAWAYDFSGDSQINIFDVQALFNRL